MSPVIPLRGMVGIPRDWSTPKWKIQIIDNDSTTWTLTDLTDTSNPPINNYCTNATVNLGANDYLSNCNITLINSDGTFTGKFNGGNTIIIYADYTNASTLVFRGKIDAQKYSFNSEEGYSIEINGRDYPELIDDESIVVSYDEATVDNALKDLLSAYFNDITFSFWEGNTWKTSGYTHQFSTITRTFVHTNGWNIIKKVCEVGSYDCYLEYISGWYLRVLQENSKINTIEHITQGVNLISVDGFGPNNDDIKNKIIVYGKQEGDVFLLKTEEDTTSQNLLWTKSKIINDSNLKLMGEVNDRANTELTMLKSQEDTGSVSSLGLYSLKPADTFPISVPYCGLNTSYKALQITHSFSMNEGFTSTVQIKQREKTAGLYIKERIDKERELALAKNINNMRETIVLFFDDEQDLTLTNCAENENSSSKLQLSTGANTGTMESLTFEIDFTATQCELKLEDNFPDTENDVYEVSADGGANYLSIEPNTVTNFTSSGSNIKIKITLNSDSTHIPAYGSIALLVK